MIPAMWGAAMDVPDRVEYVFGGSSCWPVWAQHTGSVNRHVEMIVDPGAERSGHVVGSVARPRDEVEWRVPSRVPVLPSL
jgi:hypothetical protein